MTKENTTYGTWEVFTEGDCEGKSTRFLGTFTGHVDEIALHLACKCEYTLNFKREKDSTPLLEPTKSCVDVQFIDDYGTPSQFKSLNGLKEVLKDRPVQVTHSKYYKSFKITTDDKEEVERQEALAKLTLKEREILGV